LEAEVNVLQAIQSTATTAIAALQAKRALLEEDVKLVAMQAPVPLRLQLIATTATAVTPALPVCLVDSAELAAAAVAAHVRQLIPSTATMGTVALPAARVPLVVSVKQAAAAHLATPMTAVMDIAAHPPPVVNPMVSARRRTPQARALHRAQRLSWKMAQSRGCPS